LQQEIQSIQNKRAHVAEMKNTISVMKHALDINANALSFENANLQDNLLATASERSKAAVELAKLMKLNVINDSFYIWFSGPFATINNFRLGRVPSVTVDWPEINSALGEAALAVHSIQFRIGIEFKRYGIAPMGSCSKVYRIDDRKTLYNLFIDGSFSLFPKRNFNTALGGFLSCLQEIGEYITRHDPTIQMPYEIVGGGEGKINGISILFGTDDEQWTRACKCMLTNMKWMIAWAVKHCDSS
jgi:beclin 1